MRILIINNISAGYKDGAIFDFMRSFATGDDEIVLRNITPHSKTAELLRDAEDFDLVVASGGDGTVASIVYCLRYTGIPVLPFPAGTSNALALNLFSPEEPHALAAIARDGRLLDFDIGEVSCGDHTFGFSLIAGCGYDATIMHQAEDSKKLLGPLSYVYAAFMNPNPQNARFTISLDGEVIERTGVGVLVANFSKMQFEIALTQENMPRDGLLDVVVLGTDTALALIPTFIQTLLDRSADTANHPKELEFFQASVVEIQSDPPMRVQFDGEPLQDTTPVTIKLLPEAARFVISEEAFNHYAHPEEMDRERLEAQAEASSSLSR